MELAFPLIGNHSPNQVLAFLETANSFERELCLSERLQSALRNTKQLGDVLVSSQDWREKIAQSPETLYHHLR